MNAPVDLPDRGAAPDPGVFSDRRKTAGAPSVLRPGKIPRGAEPSVFSAPPPDPALGDATVPYLPRGVWLAEDRVRGMRILQAPERALQLDPVGDAILSALDGRTLGKIVDALADTYAAPRETIRADVTAFLQGLIDRRMVFVRLP